VQRLFIGGAKELVEGNKKRSARAAEGSLLFMRRDAAERTQSITTISLGNQDFAGAGADSSSDSVEAAERPPSNRS